MGPARRLAEGGFRAACDAGSASSARRANGTPTDATPAGSPIAASGSPRRGALDARPDIAAKLDAIDRAYLAACRTREVADAAEREQARRNELARSKAEADRAHAEAERAKASARFARNLTAVFVVAALLLAGVGAWAWKQRDAAVDAAARAEAATKKRLRNRIGANLRSRKPSTRRTRWSPRWCRNCATSPG